MLSQKVFWEWFKKEVQVRWKAYTFEWTEVGDWHWRLREDFDLDTLTEAVRRHKATEDWRTPSLKKVYDYACTIKAESHPQTKHTSNKSGVPEAHTYIMCVAKSDNGRGCVGHFVPILVWPFHKTYTAETYRRIAEEQCVIHSRNGRNGVWEIFTGTTHGQMLQRRMKLTGTQPLDLKQLRKRYQIPH